MGQERPLRWAELATQLATSHSVFDYPPEIRKVIYTTNAIESINISLRKVIKKHSSFRMGEAVTRLFYLALNNISRKWSMPIRDRKTTLNRFTIQFKERLVKRFNANLFTQNSGHLVQS